MHSSVLISHLKLVQSFCSREIIEHIMSRKIILNSKFGNCLHKLNPQKNYFIFSIHGNVSVNGKDLLALTLVEPIREDPVSDSLAVQHLDNQQYILANRLRNLIWDFWKDCRLIASCLPLYCKMQLQCWIIWLSEHCLKLQTLDGINNF